MANCEHSKSCFLFNKKMDEMPRIYEYLKNEYCKNNFSECDRLMLSQSIGIENVPNDLLPFWFKELKYFCKM